jgi:uncharacterized SAM-binding protein YcdF (DUF218 family)/lysophospholipase L1-like esterase
MLAGATRVRPFLAGLLSGVILMVAAGAFINETDLADWIVAPLLVDDSVQQSDAVVVLGAGVIEGCVANTNGLRRAMLAARLYHDGKAPLVIFAGGTGDDCPVARAMGNVARQLGVPAEAIREETVSRNTYQNGAMTAPLLRAWGISNALLVTDRLHMRRASGVFNRLGFEVRPVSVPIGEGHEDNVDMLRAGVREFLALGYYRLRGWTGAAAGGVQGATPMTIVGTAAETGPIVVLGASYAAGWQPRSIGGVPIINKGIAGQQSFELLARFDADVLSERPSAVVLWGFINDIFRAPANVEEALGRARQSYTEMIARAKQHGIVPIVATEVTIRPRSATLYERMTNLLGTILGRESYQDRINAHVLAMNKWLIETAAKEGVTVLQFQSVLAEPGGRRRAEYTQPDGSHVTDAGYKMLTVYSTPILERLIRGR